jgi:cytochrome b561
MLNNKDNYGWFSILLHWLMAAALLGLFALGYFMVGLDYYSPWYNRAPHIHESIGLLFAAALLVRLAARWFNPPPPPLPGLSRTERRMAVAVHWLFYLLMTAVVVTGYTVSSAGERDIPLFSWFSVPTLPLQLEQQEDVAGKWHRWIAWTLVIISLLHGLAALKHHFIDRDRTLLRILGK